MDNRRNTIVINKNFQYQSSLLIVALAILLINGFLIFRMIFPGEQPMELTGAMATGLATVELILIASIWFGSLKVSHRIAGPVYVFAREIGKLGGGDLTASISLRDKDMFQPEAAEMNASIAALRTRINIIKGLCEQLHHAQSTGCDISNIAQQLSVEISAFTTS